MPNIAKEVFTKMDDRRGHGEDEEEEVDYVSGAGSRGWAKDRRGRGYGRGCSGKAGPQPPLRSARGHGGGGQGFRQLSRSWESSPLSCRGWGEGFRSCWEVQRSSSSPSLLDGWSGQC